jgi:hypothetical protein
MNMTELRVIITWIYNADAMQYGTSVPEEMAAIDQYNWCDVPNLCLQILEENWDNENISVKVEPVDE